MAKFAKDKYRYSDSNVNLVERRVATELGEINSNVMVLSASLDLYKMRFMRNLRYVLAYTGMSEPIYCRRMKGYGLKSTRSMLHGIENGRILGFDLLLVAAFCHEFKLPLPLVVNFDLEEKGVVLEDYGIGKDSKCTNKLKNFKYERYIKEPHNRAVSKQLRAKVLDRAVHPKELLDVWSAFNQSKG